MFDNQHILAWKLNDAEDSFDPAVSLKDHQHFSFIGHQNWMALLYFSGQHHKGLGSYYIMMH